MCIVVNKYKEDYDVYIGRGTVWGNWYSHLPETKAKYKTENREESVEKHKDQLRGQIRSGEITIDMLKALNGKRLGCFCKPKSCHGDTIALAVAWAMTK